jgi:Cof subfamily protein (haloacid dehalogenase superfamily)
MSNFSTYSALLCDVDQTITTTSNVVSLATKEAFASLVGKGKFVAAACTGRGYPMLLREGIFDLFSPDIPHVCCGGGLVISKEGKTLWHKSLDHTFVEGLIKAAEQSDSAITIKAATAIYANPIAIELYSRFTSRYDTIFEPLTLDGPWRSEPVLSMTSPQPTKEVETYLSSHNVTTKTTQSYYGHKLVDITAEGVTKLAGLTAWSKITGIPLTSCIGVGDGSNDLEFLNSVGYAVAMGNGVPEVKAMADEVTGHTDQDGLATFISTNLLGT